MDSDLDVSRRGNTLLTVGTALVTVAVLGFLAGDGSTSGRVALGWLLVSLQLGGLIALTMGLRATARLTGTRDRYMGGVAILLFLAAILVDRVRPATVEAEWAASILGKLLALSVLAALYLAGVALLSRDRIALLLAAIALVCGVFLALRTDLGARLVAVFLFDGFLLYPLLLIMLLLVVAGIGSIVRLGARGSASSRA